MDIPRAQVESVRKGGQSPAPESAKGDTEAREAFLRFHAAILAGDLDALKRESAKDNRSEMEQDPDAKAKVALIRAFTPAEVEVSSAEVHEGTAELRLAEKGGKGRTGTASLVREDGEWKILKLNWEMGELDP